MNFEKIEAKIDMNVEDLALRRVKELFPTLIGADELRRMEVPKLDWFIPNFVPVGLSILGGPKKLGKSYLVLQFCQDIIADGGKVFYFAGEDTNALQKDRHKILNFEDTKNFQYHPGRHGQFASPQAFRSKVEQMLDVHRFDVIFIDTMNMALTPQGLTPHRSDDYSYYASELRLWAELAVKHNIAIFMVHHTGKSAHVHYPDPLDHLLGSTAITATADWVLVMQKAKNSEDAMLYVEGKMAKAQEFALEKVDGIYYRIAGHAKDLALSRKKAQQEVCDCIKANPNIRQFELVQKLERSKQNVSRAVGKLIRDGYITGNSNDGYTILETP